MVTNVRLRFHIEFSHRKKTIFIWNSLKTFWASTGLTHNRSPIIYFNVLQKIYIPSKYRFCKQMTFSAPTTSNWIRCTRYQLLTWKQAFEILSEIELICDCNYSWYKNHWLLLAYLNIQSKMKLALPRLKQESGLGNMVPFYQIWL